MSTTKVLASYSANNVYTHAHTVLYDLYESISRVSSLSGCPKDAIPVLSLEGNPKDAIRAPVLVWCTCQGAYVTYIKTH